MLSGTRFTPALPLRSSWFARSSIHSRNVGIGRAAVGWVVFEAAIFGRIMRRRYDDAIGQVVSAAAVVNQNGVRDDRRRSDPVVWLDDGLDAVGRQHLKRGILRGTGERMRVLAHVQWPVRTQRGAGSRRSPA